MLIKNLGRLMVPAIIQISVLAPVRSEYICQDFVVYEYGPDDSSCSGIRFKREDLYEQLEASIEYNYCHDLEKRVESPSGQMVFAKWRAYCDSIK